MTQCAQCGNDYANAMTIERQGEVLTFDCFECAIQMMAPACENCGCRVIGHGIETASGIYCCAHCAHHEGASKVRDNEAHAKPT